VAPRDLQTKEEIWDYAERYHPGYAVVEIEPHEDNDVADEGYAMFAVQLQEKPEFQPFSIVIEQEVEDAKGKVHPGYVVAKSIVSGSMLFDDERCLKVDSDLYYEVTEYANWDTLSSLGISNLELKLKAAGYPRVPKNPDDLTDEQQEAIAEFLYEGPKTIKLLVRYAKEDEVGQG
jgi:hypothetical protein